MQSTRDKVLSELQARGFKQRGKQWRGNHPLKPDSDSQSFVVTFHDGEHGAFDYKAGNEQGSLYDLATMLGIELPRDNRPLVIGSKTAYQDLADYAKRHYAPEQVFLDAKWETGTYASRPVLKWPVRTGIHARFMDAEGGYVWIGNGGNCWYGLDRAVKMALDTGKPLILCNGEASTIVAQYHGIAAFCGTGGEGAVNDDMLSELNAKWGNGQALILALDCDSAGQQAAQGLREKLGRGVIVDLGLSDKGDLADFCGLHRELVGAALERLVDGQRQQDTTDAAQFIEFVSSTALLTDFQRFVEDDPALFGRVIKMPFPSMRVAGGFAEIITTKKIWFIGNVSGGGKTILSESLCDEFNCMGYNVFYIGDEWSAMEFGARQTQRAYPNSDVVRYIDYLKYANGQLDISDNQRHAVAQAIRTIRSRQGQTYVMRVNSKLTAHNPALGVMYLEDIMTAAAGKIRDIRANGGQVDIVIIDYLSLYETKGRANNLEEYKAGVFKSYCKTMDILGISTVQVNKESEDRVKSKGGMLNQHDLYWVRPDKANLITTMNRLYKPRIAVEGDLDSRDAIKPYLDEQGQPTPTPNFAMSVVKNSVGAPYHHSYFHFDYARLRVVEGLHPDYYYDTYYRIPMKHVRAHSNSSNNGAATKMTDSQLENL